MTGPLKEMEEHLNESEFDEAMAEIQSNEKRRLILRLRPIKNFYAGGSVTEAASRIGVTQRDPVD